MTGSRLNLNSRREEMTANEVFKIYSRGMDALLTSVGKGEFIRLVVAR